MNSPKTVNIFDLSYAELENILLQTGEPRYRALQVWQGLYHQLWVKADSFTNLPQNLREKINLTFSQEFSGNLSGLLPVATMVSRDGNTQKILFQLSDGRLIETVLMCYEKRRTLCISTQSGCAMGCTFCATGQMGFGRNLSSGEIVEQVLYFARHLAARQEKVTNVVLMGMGEPFHNYEATMAAIDRLSDQQGFNLGERRFTISTVGVVPAIRRFAAEHRQVNLAVSLHAAENHLRSSMLPINRKYPLETLMEACREYIAVTHRRISFEWALIKDVNDTPEQAEKLARLLKGLQHNGVLLAHVNAIPLNPTQQFQGKAADRKRAEQFKSILESHGIACTIRMRRGIEIQAGCGQLAGHQ